MASEMNFYHWLLLFFLVSNVRSNNLWHQFGSREYLVQFSSVTKAEVDTACANYSGIPVVIETVEIENFLFDIIGKNQSYEFYIGLRLGLNGTFVWSDNTKLTSASYLNWAAGHPTESVPDKDCVIYRLSTNYTWVDVPCNTTASFICQRDASSGGEEYLHAPTSSVKEEGGLLNKVRRVSTILAPEIIKRASVVAVPVLKELSGVEIPDELIKASGQVLGGQENQRRASQNISDTATGNESDDAMGEMFAKLPMSMLKRASNALLENQRRASSTGNPVESDDAIGEMFAKLPTSMLKRASNAIPALQPLSNVVKGETSIVSMATTAVAPTLSKVASFKTDVSPVKLEENGITIVDETT